ncbi:porin [Silvimonas iriomotensis]|uniref:Membrane protein n=1 Tax=Silvimonas iriomotensis TaxID=449662 RepID=A0ABQ2P916_9NEIS|nr:porin [Silvimonas iriomotensis]GGP20805.1 membrane protein [Silvimonas iriomotensis]
MKIKYATLAVALALGTGAAMADVTIDGSITGGVDYMKAGNTKSGGVSYDAIIGVSGSDKLDAGGKVIWRVEQEIQNQPGNRTQGGTANWGNRQAYIGLTGDYGTFRAGNMLSPTYDALDRLYGDTGAEWFARDYGFAQSNYAKNVLRYDMPSLYGFNASAAYFLEDQSRQGSKGYDLTANYKWQGLGIDGTYQHRNNVTSEDVSGQPVFADGIDSKNWYAGANYKFDNGFGLKGGFKRAEASNAGDDVKQDMWIAQGSYEQGKHGVYLSYINLRDAKLNGASQNDSGAQAVDARYNYSLSKHSLAYVDARYVKNGDNASYSAADDVMYYGNDTTAAAGENSYRVMTGLKTWF